jgi:tetratricopeptide (TPR) repeat protein
MKELPDRPSKLQKYFENGLKAMASQDYDGAAAWFSAVLEYSPLDTEAQEMCEKAQILYAQKKLSFLTRLTYSVVGNFLAGLNMHKSAVHYLGVLSFDKPQDPIRAAKYGKALAANDNPALAAMAYRRALKFLPQNKSILKGAGPVFEAIDDKPAAIEVYVMLNRLEPKDGIWPIKVKDLSAEHYGKTGGITDLKVSRSEEERKAAQQQTVEGKEQRIKELLDRYKENPEEKAGVLPEVGRLLVQIGRWDHALTIWKKVLEASEEGDEEAEQMIATCYEKKGDLDEAEKRFGKLQKDHPLDPRYCDSVFGVRLSRIDKELEAAPEDTALLQDRERLEREHLETKTEIYREMTEKRAGDPDLLLTYGNLLQQCGRVDDAIPVLQKVGQNPARAYPALRKLGGLFIEKGQMPLAIDTFKRALEKAPQSKTVSAEVKEIWYGLGEAYLRLGDRDNAREWFKHVYECDIQYRDIREKYESLIT